MKQSATPRGVAPRPRAFALAQRAVVTDDHDTRARRAKAGTCNRILALKGQECAAAWRCWHTWATIISCFVVRSSLPLQLFIQWIASGSFEGWGQVCFAATRVLIFDCGLGVGHVGAMRSVYLIALVALGVALVSSDVVASPAEAIGTFRARCYSKRLCFYFGLVLAIVSRLAKGKSIALQ